MGSGHDHGLSEVRHEKPLWWALGLTGTFLIAEVIGGLLTNSLALLSDAAHMATDTAGLVIALVAVRLARRPPDARRTFGYARLEALGALANGTMLLGVAAYILWEAVGRFREPPPVAATGMLVIAIMRPQLLLETQVPEYERYDMVLILDRSVSMYAQDIRPSRFSRAVAEIKTFLTQKPDTIEL